MILQNVYNFRDLGNAAVRSGLIFRSGELSEAAACDLEALQAFNIQYVLDLRPPLTYTQKPDRVPGTAQTMLLCEQLSENAPMSKKPSRSIRACCNEAPGERSKRNYRSMVTHYTLVFSKALKVIASASTPLLFHCEMGKDRAGVLSALLYQILGVSRDDIMADYLLSNDIMHDVNEKDLAFFSEKENLSAAEINSLRALFEVRAEYLDTFFEEANRQYGSFEQYVQNGLMLNERDIHELRKRLLK